MADFNVGTKLAGGFAITILIFLVVAVTGYFNMKSINDKLNAMYSEKLLRIQACGELTTDLNIARSQVYQV